MKQEERIVRFDEELEIEAYRFIGIMKKFPNHFHEHYVLGFIECGNRHLSYNNEEFTIGSGDMILFNPMDNHACEQVDDQTLDYRCINIKPEIMQKLIYEITGRNYQPEFTTPVICGSEQISLLRELHQMLMEERENFRVCESFSVNKDFQGLL